MIFFVSIWWKLERQYILLQQYMLDNKEKMRSINFRQIPNRLFFKCFIVFYVPGYMIYEPFTHKENYLKLC